MDFISRPPRPVNLKVRNLIDISCEIIHHGLARGGNVVQTCIGQRILKSRDGYECLYNL